MTRHCNYFAVLRKIFHTEGKDMVKVWKRILWLVINNEEE
jgi:hypothetical protein